MVPGDCCFPVYCKNVHFHIKKLSETSLKNKSLADMSHFSKNLKFAVGRVFVIISEMASK